MKIDEGYEHGGHCEEYYYCIVRVLHLHEKSEGPAGMTDGYCSECQVVWPCPTFHAAMGWGDWEECWEQHWCSHAAVVLQ